VMYEESVRVPLLIRYPNGSCRTTDQPVSSIDLFPTILDLAGAEIPASAEGKSLVGENKGTDVYFEHKQDAVIRENIKLIVERDSEDIIACYDLQADPFELNNISNTLDDEIRADMLKSLCSWRTRIRS